MSGNGPSSQRTFLLSALAIGLGLGAGVVAWVLTRLIGLVTNVAYFGRIATDWVSPADAPRTWMVVVVPVVGGLAVGAMARWGSSAIRGHGIPEVMENVLLRQSRIPVRLAWLKPLSAAVAIGTGGPFGAEGPIIATGGSIGSLVGQVVAVTAAERKVLLAAGAAAGMAATFGSPLAAVLLAVELLLFEFRQRSLVPVALAAAVATIVRFLMTGSTAPAFPSPPLSSLSAPALLACLALGVFMGGVAVIVTRIVYGVEDLFERLPLHWGWWPAIGGVAVGVTGWFFPDALHVGYDKIDGILAGRFTMRFLALLLLWKLGVWAIALGSGTSGGTLAPLFMIGGAIGELLGHGLRLAAPRTGVAPELLGLVGMAALFAGASRSMLASAVFAFEVTRQPGALLGLLVGCAVSELVASHLSATSIMTEKIARRGVRVGKDYERDPVIDPSGRFVGIFRRKWLVALEVPPESPVVAADFAEPSPVCHPDDSLKEVAERMVAHDAGRLPVVDRADPTRLVGFITRRDVIAGRSRRLREEQERTRVIALPFAGAGGDRRDVA